MGGNRHHGYDNWGKEATKQNEQLYTNYKQADFLHKINYRINNKNNLLLNTQYSTSSNIYRFDNGLIPTTLKNWAEDISELSKKSLSHINKLYNYLMSKL